MPGRLSKEKILQLLTQIQKELGDINKGSIAEIIRRKAPNTDRFSQWITKAYEVEDVLVRNVKIEVTKTARKTEYVVVATPDIYVLEPIIEKKERMIKNDLRDMGLPFDLLKEMAIIIKKKELQRKAQKPGSKQTRFKNVKEMIAKVEEFRNFYEYYCSEGKCDHAERTLSIIRDIMENLGLNVNDLIIKDNEEKFRELTTRIKNYWRNTKKLDDNTINTYSALIRTFLEFHKVPRAWLKKYLKTHRYKGKYGKTAFFDDQDLIDVLRELKKMYEDGEIDYTRWRKDIAGVVAQHETCCRIEGLKTMRFDTRVEEYEIEEYQDGELVKKKIKVPIYITITKEKQGKDWERPIKPEWYELIKDWLPLSDLEADHYVHDLRKAYLRVCLKRKIIKPDQVDEVVKLAKRQQIDKLEELIGSRKWAYALAKPSHVLRHTAIHHWGYEVQRDVAFINAMSHEDVGIYVNVYGTLSLKELAGIIYKIPSIRKDHDEVLKKARELGLI